MSTRLWSVVVRSSQKELADLREACFIRDELSCRWPGCDMEITYAVNPLEMAHIQHRGIGGSVARNELANVISLCRQHHDCLDGRTGLGILRQELNRMLKAQL